MKTNFHETFTTHMLERKVWRRFQLLAFKVEVPIEFILGICVTKLIT